MSDLKQRIQEMKAKVAANNNPRLQKLQSFLQKRYNNAKKNMYIILASTIGLGSVAYLSNNGKQKDSDHSKDFTTEQLNDIKSSYEQGTRPTYDEALAMLDSRVSDGTLKTDTMEMHYGDAYPAQMIFYGNYENGSYDGDNPTAENIIDNTVAEKIIFHDGTVDLTLRGTAQEVEYTSWKDGEHTETVAGNLSIEDYYFAEPERKSLIDEINCHPFPFREFYNGRIVTHENGDAFRQLYVNATENVPFVLNTTHENTGTTSVSPTLLPEAFPYVERTFSENADIHAINANLIETTSYEADGTKIATDRLDEQGRLSSRTRSADGTEYTVSFTYNNDKINTVTWSSEGAENVSLDVINLPHNERSSAQYAHLTPQEAARCNRSNIISAVVNSYIESGEEIQEGSDFYPAYKRSTTDKAKSIININDVQRQ